LDVVAPNVGEVDDSWMSSVTETVSVLMTDLVGSTAMADRLGPAATQEVRSEHFRLLRRALERTGGREVKNLGDGLMVVFRGASQALTCAALMQQLVDARNRSTEPHLDLRIGVSLGEATVEDGDVFGEPVVEAARLCALAAGGQILVNALLRQLAGSHGEHSFKAVGTLELKGIAERVEAVELHWERARADRVALPERLRELPATGYVGRVAERERLTELWGQVRSGSRRLALIAGEAGVGKTRLSTHLAQHIYEQGATVLYGRCDEDLGVPYQPWAQGLGHLVKEAPRKVLDTHLKRHAGTLTRLVPALSDRVPDLPSPRESDPETERYLLYAAVAGLLEEAGKTEPLLVILDDLHWADPPTLSLLRHVVSAGSASMRVLIVGAYRDSELSENHPLTGLLADLHRERGVERVKLTGLHSEEVEALMEAAAGHDLDEEGRALAAEIARETAGNPFFAVELFRHLAESGAIVRAKDARWRLVGNLDDLGLPQSVREVIGRRVTRLGPDARAALSAAAVIGRDFDVDLLLAVLELSEPRLLDLLQGAVAGSLLKENRTRPGRFTFIHALVEHTLYEDLGLTRRALLHRQVAEALEAQYGNEPGERLGELAGHWAAAVVATDTAKAIHYARLAAERGLEALAPAEAARWYRQALELHERAPSGDRAERCELLIGLGEAQRQTGNAEFRQTLLDAARAAQELDDADRLCTAVLANSRGWFSQMQGAIDIGRVQALEAAAVAVPPDDPRRARVLALLASELQYAGEPARCRVLASESIELAKATGDPEALAHALLDAFMGIWTADTLQQRGAMTRELVELAHRLDDPRLSVGAAVRTVIVGMESGDRRRVESGLAVMRTQAALVPEPSMTWLHFLYEAGCAALRGELEAAERWGVQGFEVGKASGQPDAVAAFGMQLVQVRYFQDRVGELVEPSVRLARRPDSHWLYRATGALALVESGREDEAYALAAAEDLHNAPWDWHWAWTMFIWVHVCCRLGLVDRQSELYELLVPFSTQLVGSGTSVWGSIAWTLGTLATSLKRYQVAVGHFRTAAEIEDRLVAPLLLARTRVGWARALIARGRYEDLPGATRILEQAHETATRLGGALVCREVAGCRSDLAAIHG
jgi:class 3 adenylate cyclase/tetratricopeptide (TPR) repeat protein